MKPHKRLKFDRNTCTWIWWHISAITCHLIMSTSQNFMLTCQIILLLSKKMYFTLINSRIVVGILYTFQGEIGALWRR